MTKYTFNVVGAILGIITFNVVSSLQLVPAPGTSCNTFEKLSSICLSLPAQGHHEHNLPIQHNDDEIIASFGAVFLTSVIFRN